MAESKYTTSGRFLLDLGYYDPHTKKFSVDKEKILEWLNKGAQPSNTLSKLLKNEKVKHSSVVVIKRHKKSKKAVADTVEKAAKSDTGSSGVGPEVTPEASETSADSAELQTSKVDPESVTDESSVPGDPSAA